MKRVTRHLLASAFDGAARRVEDFRELGFTEADVREWEPAGGIDGLADA